MPHLAPAFSCMALAIDFRPVPVRRRARDACLLGEVGAVVDEARLDVPRDAVRRSVDLGGLLGTLEEHRLVDLPGVGSRAPSSANSPIHVVPTIATSGVLLAVIAVVNLSCAASQGMAVTSTLAPGLAASNSFASAGRFSPSAPMAQTVMVPVAAPLAPPRRSHRRALGGIPRPQADMVSAAAATPATVMVEVRLIGLSLSRWWCRQVGSRVGFRADERPAPRTRRSHGERARWAARVACRSGLGSAHQLVEAVGREGSELVDGLTDRRQPRAGRIARS